MEQLLPIPTIVLLVEAFKLIGLPAVWVKPVVLALAILFGVIYFWNKDLAICIGAVLGYAVSSMGTYSGFIKPIKDIAKDL